MPTSLRICGADVTTSSGDGLRDIRNYPCMTANRPDTPSFEIKGLEVKGCEVHVVCGFVLGSRGSTDQRSGSCRSIALAVGVGAA